MGTILFGSNNSLPPISVYMYVCIYVYIYIHIDKQYVCRVGLHTFFHMSKIQKSLKDFFFFGMPDMNSGSRTDLRLFVVIMHPITVIVDVLPGRNVNVLEYRVLCTIQLMYLRMFLHVKTSENFQTHLASGF